MFIEKAFVPFDQAQDRLQEISARITSVCFSPTLHRRIALGFVPWEARYPGTRISAAGVGATVTRLPFYDPPKLRPRTQL